MTKKKKDFQVLQIGGQDWGQLYAIPENTEWTHLPLEDLSAFVEERLAAKEAYNKEQKERQALAEEGKPVKEKPQYKLPLRYSALILPEQDYPEDLLGLLEDFEVYEVFYALHHQPQEPTTQEFLTKKMAHRVDFIQPQPFIDKLKYALFSGQYGAKMHANGLEITHNFRGNVRFEGQQFLIMDGDYGTDFQQVAYYRYNLSHYGATILNLFFEHLIEGDIELKVRIQLIQNGSLNTIIKEWEFDPSEGRDEFILEADSDGYLMIAIWAKGEGELKIGPCHYRYGRFEFGEFILGGQRFVDSQNQEFMYYFDPQDFKPPLCVYFSGFRTAEGFEGFWMMKAMKTPFMLICDPRLDGGGFYIGTPELEDKISGVIQEKLDFLGFDRSQLILSGLSMGTFGATYHGARLCPHAIVIGKPVFNLGQVALKEKIIRPSGFPTSLDLLLRFGGGMGEPEAQIMDQYFWKQFDQADFSKTKFAIAYMKDDDYDSTAFREVLEKTNKTKAKVIGRGWAGRHGDGGSGPTNWFLKQYYDILKNDFGR